MAPVRPPIGAVDLAETARDTIRLHGSLIDRKLRAQRIYLVLRDVKRSLRNEVLLNNSRCRSRLRSAFLRSARDFANMPLCAADVGILGAGIKGKQLLPALNELPFPDMYAANHRA